MAFIMLIFLTLTPVLILVKADLSSNMIENAYIKSDEKYYKELVKRASDMKK